MCDSMYCLAFRPLTRFRMAFSFLCVEVQIQLYPRTRGWGQG